MAKFIGGRWRNARTGRLVRNSAVAAQLGVPVRTVRGNHREPQRWTEVTAVARIREKGRYVEALRRRVLHDATKRELRKAYLSVRREARALLKSKLTAAESKKWAKKIWKATRPEVRSRVTRPTAEGKVEERMIGTLPAGWDDDKQKTYKEWWAGLDKEQRKEIGKYLPVEVVAWLKGEGEDMPSRRWLTDSAGRRHDLKTGRFM